MRLHVVNTCLVASALVALPAHAETQSLHIEFAAPAGCSNRATFVAELVARTGRVRVVDAAEPGATIHVQLSDRTTGVVGELRLRELDGTETVRSISGKTCEEVVPALALIAAVLVDPESQTRPTEAPPAPSPAPPPAPEDTTHLRPTLGMGASVTSAVAPEAAIAPSVELGLDIETAGQRGPMLSVALERFTSSSVETPAGVADFTTTLGRAMLCPLRWPRTGWWFVAPCGAFEAGALHVEVSQSLDEQEPTVLWLATGPVVHVEARPIRLLAIGLDVMAIFPLVRDDFHFSPGYPVFSIPVLGWTGRVGVKAVFR